MSLSKRIKDRPALRRELCRQGFDVPAHETDEFDEFVNTVVTAEMLETDLFASHFDDASIDAGSSDTFDSGGGASGGGGADGTW